MQIQAVSSGDLESSSKRAFSGRIALFGCLAGCLLGALGFMAVLAALPRVYLSRAVVQLKTERGPGEGDVKPEVSLPDRIRELFVAGETVGPVVEQFGLTKLWRVDAPEAAKRIRDDVRVEWARGRDAYAVTYRHSDPLMSAAIVNALVDSCQERMQEAQAKAGMEIVITSLPMIVLERAAPVEVAWYDPWRFDLPRTGLVWTAAGGALGLIVSFPFLWRRKRNGV